jgi:hypothetical protein
MPTKSRKKKMPTKSRKRTSSRKSKKCSSYKSQKSCDRATNKKGDTMCMWDDWCRRMTKKSRRKMQQKKQPYIQKFSGSGRGAVFKYARKIRKPGENWQKAVKRAGRLLKKLTKPSSTKKKPKSRKTSRRKGRKSSKKDMSYSYDMSQGFGDVAWYE